MSSLETEKLPTHRINAQIMKNTDAPENSDEESLGGTSKGSVQASTGTVNNLQIEVVSSITEDQPRSKGKQITVPIEIHHFRGQLPGTPPTVPGNMSSLETEKLPTLTVPGNMSSLETEKLPTLLVTQPLYDHATRHAREIYVGWLPPTANVESVKNFFNHSMSLIGGNTAGEGDAVAAVYLDPVKKISIVEMRSVEEASNAMALDGISFEGAAVIVRRPSKYNPTKAATLGPSQPSSNLNLAAVGLTPDSAGALDPDCIFVGNLPIYFTEAPIRELLEKQGPLRGVVDLGNDSCGVFKNFAYAVYEEAKDTDKACTALNGTKVLENSIVVKRAHQQPPVAATSKVLCLTEGIQPDELKDDEDYTYIVEDMRVRCEKFGKLVNLVIPRPGPSGEKCPGVGKVFLEYTDTEGASKARQDLHGRYYGGNQVVAVFYPEKRFSEGDYTG